MTITVLIEGSLLSCPAAGRPAGWPGGRGERETSRSRRFLSRDGESMYGIAVGMAKGQFPSFVGCLPLLFLIRADIDRQHTLLGLYDISVKARNNGYSKVHQAHVRGKELGLEAPILTGIDHRTSSNGQRTRETQDMDVLACKESSKESIKRLNVRGGFIVRDKIVTRCTLIFGVWNATSQRSSAAIRNRQSKVRRQIFRSPCRESASEQIL